MSTSFHGEQNPTIQPYLAALETPADRDIFPRSTYNLPEVMSGAIFQGSNDQMIDQFPKHPLSAFIASVQEPGRLDPNPTMLPTLQTADVIFGHDVTIGTTFLVFGRDVLHAIVNSGMARPIRGLVIDIDQGKDSEELGKLIAMIRVVKGRDEYIASETIQIDEDQTE